jgi:hypothetical protein
LAKRDDAAATGDGVTVTIDADRSTASNDSMPLSEKRASGKSDDHPNTGDIDDVVTSAREVVLIRLNDRLRVLVERSGGDLANGHDCLSTKTDG